MEQLQDRDDNHEQSPQVMKLEDLFDPTEWEEVKDKFEEMEDALSDDERSMPIEQLQDKYRNGILLEKVVEGPNGPILLAPYSSEWYCNICRNAIRSHTKHYTCLDCVDYDLCSKCYVEHGKAHNGSRHVNCVSGEVENYFTKIIQPIKDAVEYTSNRTTSLEIMLTALEYYSDRPCIGERMYKLNNQGKKEYLEAYSWIYFEALLHRVNNFGSGLVNSMFQSRDFLGICANNSVDWIVTDMACLRQSIVSVPIQHTLMPSDINYIIRNSRMKAIVLSVDMLPLVLSSIALEPCPELKYLIQMEDINNIPEEHLQTIDILGLSITTMPSIEATGASNPVEPVYSAPDDIITIAYTSGSTSMPKGAIFTERLWRNEWYKPVVSTFPTIRYNYLPFSHLTGRLSVIQIVGTGGRLALATDDMSNIFEETQIVSPVTFPLVPRVSEMIYEHYQTACAKEAHKHPQIKRSTINRRVRQQMRRMLGHRLLKMSVGTAPSNPRTILFLKKTFGVPINEGYGSTEAGSITVDGVVKEGIDVKLVDVPELDYYLTDKPYPRGEVCVKSEDTIPGYYNDEAANSELLDENGYVRTGDIAEMRENGQLVLIDRKKFIFKLSNGEFVSPSKIESIFSECSSISQILVDGNSLRPYLLAVIVPNLEVFNNWKKERKASEEEALATLRKKLRKEINMTAIKHRMRSYEIPRDFIIELTPFNETGLMTVSSKLARARARQYYKSRLEDMYSEHERMQREKREDLNIQTDTDQKVLLAMEIVLGVEISSPDTDSFIQLGGDSLSASKLSSILLDSCRVKVPVAMIINPSTTVSELQNYIAERKSGELRETGDRIYPQDVQLSAEVIESLNTQRIQQKTHDGAGSVLLTGANGFLGRFILCALLEQYPENVNIWTIIRASDNESARTKLIESLHPSMKSKVDCERVKVLAGDITKEDLGLDVEALSELETSVTTVIHNAAMVNHIFDYDEHYLANVKATENIIHFAAKGTPKSVTYVSSISVYNGTQSDALEDLDMRNESQGRKRGDGYGASKWAAEILIERTRDLGLEAVIIRPGMIVGDTQFGDCNKADWFVRLICGLVTAGIRPHSFYHEYLRTCFFDAAPADYVAKTIVTICKSDNKQRGGKHRFNVSNTNTAPPSLDKITDWIQTYGFNLYSLPRNKWYKEIGEELKKKYSALPQPPQWSLLPLLPTFAKPMIGDLGYSCANTEYLVPEKAPLLTEATVHKYLRFLIESGMIPKCE